MHFRIFDVFLGNIFGTIGKNEENINDESPVITGGIYGPVIFNGGRVYGTFTSTPTIKDEYALVESQDKKGITYKYLAKILSEKPVAEVNAENINTNNLKEGYFVNDEENDVYKFYTIQSAIDASKNGATIIMMEDRKILGIGDDASLVIPKGKTLTIDLNGKTISGSKKSVIENLGALKIIDSSSEKTGKIEQLLKNTSNYAYNKAITSKGILMLEGITIESKDAGVVYAYDREIKSNTDIIIMNSTINAKSYGIHNEAGTVEVDETEINVSASGELISCIQVYNLEGTVNIDDSNIIIKSATE